MTMHQTFDAQAALGFVVNQTSHIEREVNETVYPDIQYPRLIPVDTSAHPWAQTVTYYSSDKYGQAGWINGNAGDIPLAGSERAQHKTAVHMAGVGYGFGMEEVQHAQMLGINLTADDAMAARRAYEEFVDGVALRGDDEKGLDGLLDHSAITPAGATTGDWSTATEDQMLADVNDALYVSYGTTKQTTLADTLLLPFARINKLATTRLGDTSQTLLQFLRANNTYTAISGQPLLMVGVRGLETAGVGDTARMVAYRRSPQVLKLHIPMPHRFLPPFQKTPLYTEVPGIFRLGGLDIRRPAEVVYRDGI